MKKFIFFTFIIISLFWVNACIEEMPIIGNIEILTTKVVPHTLSVTVSGKIVVPPERTVLERGIAYGGSPHNLSSHIVLSQTINAGFTQSVNNLKAGTTYYFATYAKLKGNKIIYGKVLSCTTMVGKVPTVQTVAFSNVTATSFDCGGVVLSKGESSIIRQGIIYGTIEIPTDTLFYVDLTQDKFTLTIPKLTQGITYYYRAFARNKGGIALGDIYTYRLGAVLTTTAVTAITATTATLGGNITDDGSVPITERGICYATTPIPTISNHKVESGSGKGSFSVDLSSLSANTFYYCRSYAINNIGIYYGNEIVFITLTNFGIPFEMIPVAGGTFTMGSPTTEADRGSDETQHPVTLSSYQIGKYEVTQAEWKAVMGGENPSNFTGDNLPVEGVSWDYIQFFIQKLNTLTGKNYRLPTEAEWEYAARGGNQSKGYLYSGSDNLDEVAWYDSNSGSKTHAVGEKRPNELGIYDMSGNVWEWCSDWYDTYPTTLQTDPTGPVTGTSRVFRGGSWYGNAQFCRSAYRSSGLPYYRYGYLGFRLVLSEKNTPPPSLPPFEMLPVAGGTFVMGSPLTDIYRDDNETQHPVTLSSYEIGKYEVTQAQWKAVMGGENPSRHKGDNLPIENVSWDEVQKFIRKLNTLTGKNYRLPTEAEWEYAARGGSQSKGYLYSGSNKLYEVAWYYDNSGNRTYAVGGKRPNELGIYDMTGNVSEWCNDWYNSAYPTTLQTDPTGPATGTYRVGRGGSWYSRAQYCRSAFRNGSNPSISLSSLGFRLVLRP